MFRGVASKLALVLLLLIAATVGATLLIIHDLWFYGILTAAVACLLLGGVFRLYRSNTRKITFMFNAIENNDYAFQFTRYGSSLSATCSTGRSTGSRSCWSRPRTRRSSARNIMS